MNQRSRTRQEDSHFRILRLLQEEPTLTQRELSERLGISLGRLNYCIRALLDKGWIKIQNFQNSDRKLSYGYLLTPRGATEKAQITTRFLRRKIAEYEQLKAEIESLKREI
jgi:EPS-associated MarR family transcriptional regulator